LAERKASKPLVGMDKFNLFGKSKPKEAPTPPPPPPPAASQGQDSSKAAMTKLVETIRMMEKREEHIQHKCDKEQKDAKAFVTQGKKKEAMACLKRKTMYNKQLEQLSIQKLTLEQQKMALENTKFNAELLQTTKLVAAEMQKQHKQMGGVDAVEEAMDHVEDNLQDAHEIQEAMAREIANPGMEADDDELLAELEEYEQEELTAGLGKVDLGQQSESIALPDTPVVLPDAGKGKVAKTAEEEELELLAQSMAM